MTRIQIWDWPTRLVHWLLVALIAFSWGSAEYGAMDYHRYSGYTVLGLLVFRLYWGFFGSATARFAQFVKGPRAIADYVRNGTKTAGHNPLGALSVMTLLLLLLAQVAFGLFAVDIDGLESGPLSHLVSFDAGRTCAKVHEWIFNALMVMVILHVVAILFYLVVKRDNLIGPMITGQKAVIVPMDSVSAPLMRVIIGIALAGVVVWWVV